MRGQANQGKNSISRIRCLEHARAIEQLEEEQPWISGQRKLQEPKVVGIIRERAGHAGLYHSAACLVLVVGFFQKKPELEYHFGPNSKGNENADSGGFANGETVS